MHRSILKENLLFSQNFDKNITRDQCLRSLYLAKFTMLTPHVAIFNYGWYSHL